MSDATKLGGNQAARSRPQTGLSPSNLQGQVLQGNCDKTCTLYPFVVGFFFEGKNGFWACCILKSPRNKAQ